jgi:hypothetical protein
MTHRTIARRDVLKFAASSGLVLLPGVGQRAWASDPSSEYLFSLGVASGDPWPDGFVLWTRLAPVPLDSHGGMPMRVVSVDWEVAEDEGFTRVVNSGVADARPELGHSVHVEATGLRPGWRYWYRFRANDQVSPICSLRTPPRRSWCLTTITKSITTGTTNAIRMNRPPQLSCCGGRRRCRRGTSTKDTPADNPHCQLYDARRGYQVFDIGRDSWRTDVWTLDKVSEKGAAATLTTSFVVERGRVVLNRAS